MPKNLLLLFVLLLGVFLAPVSVGEGQHQEESRQTDRTQSPSDLVARLFELSHELENTTDQGQIDELTRQVGRVFDEFKELPEDFEALEDGGRDAQLRQGHEFPELAFAGDAKSWLLARIENLKVELLGTVRESRRDEIFLEIGDAYHWLGHIAEEDEDDFEAAHSYFDDSIRFYRESRTTRSERINDLDTLDHAFFHVQRISRRLGAPGSLMDFATDHFEQSAARKSTRGLPTRHYPASFASRCVRAIQHKAAEWPEFE